MGRIARKKKKVRARIQVKNRTLLEILFEHVWGRQIGNGTWFRAELDLFFVLPEKTGLGPSSFTQEDFMGIMSPSLNLIEPKLSDVVDGVVTHWQNSIF